jgi:DNA-binding Lrp family transcriptional regulator
MTMTSSDEHRAESTRSQKSRLHDVQPTVTPVDLAIIDVLRRDARTPNNAVAAAVRIAPSTCLGRIRMLERRGVLRGYHAEVSLEALGRRMQAMIAVRLRAGARHRLREFTDQIGALPEVCNLFVLGGIDDFFIHVAVADSAALRDFVLDRLSVNPEVASTQTNVIFEHVRGGW